MKPPPSAEQDRLERLWRNVFFGLSALMAASALVDLEAGRLAGAAGDAGVCCLMLSLMNQFPVVRAIVGTATKRTSPEELRRQSEKLRDDAPWTERLAGIGWSLLLGSLVLRAFGFD